MGPSTISSHRVGGRSTIVVIIARRVARTAIVHVRIHRRHSLGLAIHQLAVVERRGDVVVVVGRTGADYVLALFLGIMSTH